MVSKTNIATIFVLVSSARLVSGCAEFSRPSSSVRFLNWFSVLFPVMSSTGILGVVVLVSCPGITFTPPF